MITKILIETHSKQDNDKHNLVEHLYEIIDQLKHEFDNKKSAKRFGDQIDFEGTTDNGLHNIEVTFEGQIK